MANEKRLIDPNALESKMCSLCDEFGTDHLFIDAIVYEIGNAPIVDAVEVVRCEKCKHWQKCESSLIGDVMCCTGQGSMYIQKAADDFCSYGERRADNVDD